MAASEAPARPPRICFVASMDSWAYFTIDVGNGDAYRNTTTARLIWRRTAKFWIVANLSYIYNKPQRKQY